MVRESLEEGLGITFEGPKGEHFFRSALVQTLYYGLFSLLLAATIPREIQNLVVNSVALM